MNSIHLSPDLLREARETAGLSQIQAAVAVGISRATLQNAEAGRFTPRADALARMAALYRVSLDSLFIHEPVHTTNGDSRGRQEATDTEATPPATRQNREGAAQ